VNSRSHYVIWSRDRPLDGMEIVVAELFESGHDQTLSLWSRGVVEKARRLHYTEAWKLQPRLQYTSYGSTSSYTINHLNQPAVGS
jgi:hypothetical protein